MQRYSAWVGALLLVCWATAGRALEVPAKEKPADLGKEVAAARDKGLDWLTKNQAKDGSWGKTYTLAVTSCACLAYLSDTEEPFKGDRGDALVKGLKFLMANQKDGMFTQQGHTWIHGQGFAALALSEAYGRSLLCKTKPDLDMKKVKEAVSQAVALIAKNQSASGGWWYTPGAPAQHEGSTTVCAVQALVSAHNFGLKTDEKALDQGFAYLKKCQNPDGSFQYSLGDGSHMKEGTAGDVATLGMMEKFDNKVMINGYKFLLALTPAAMGRERFPCYGHFYGCVGMMLLGQEFKDDKEFRENTQAYITGVQKDLLSWQAKDGSWPLKDQVGEEDAGFSTAFTTLSLGVPAARLSIYNREPPKLPKEGEK